MNQSDTPLYAGFSEPDRQTIHRALDVLKASIVGRVFDDATVLIASRAYERATNWHTQRPVGF